MKQHETRFEIGALPKSFGGARWSGVAAPSGDPLRQLRFVRVFKRTGGFSAEYGVAFLSTAEGS
jgi:hypothetical protein